MFSHSDIWQAIDELTKKVGFSTSGMAKRARLSPLALNKSQRIDAQGQPIWPSTELISKLLFCTNTGILEFSCILEEIYSDKQNEDYENKIQSE